jgi:hypothetical protein
MGEGEDEGEQSGVGRARASRPRPSRPHARSSGGSGSRRCQWHTCLASSQPEHLYHACSRRVHSPHRLGLHRQQQQRGHSPIVASGSVAAAAALMVGCAGARRPRRGCRPAPCPQTAASSCSSSAFASPSITTSRGAYTTHRMIRFILIQNRCALARTGKERLWALARAPQLMDAYPSAFNPPRSQARQDAAQQVVRAIRGR